MGKRRRLAAAGLTLALAVAACGSSSSPSASAGPGATSAGSEAATLTAGLAANLDKLTSYRFTWSYFGSGSVEGGAGASPAPAGVFEISGTAVNSPVAGIDVTYEGVRYVQVGHEQWTSLDGTSWYDSSGTGVDLAALLPTAEYARWFDANSAQFGAAGDETRNGIACTYFRGGDILAKLYGVAAGSASTFRAELWVARDGGYPVSGVYGFPADTAGRAGSFGYRFDITNVNDPANKVGRPADVVAVPT